MYVNITYRRVEVCNKASKVDGIHTKSLCTGLVGWWRGLHGRSVECALIGFKGQLEQRIGISGGLFAY